MVRTRTAAAVGVLLTASAIPFVTAGPATAAASTLPWDFNGDGHADLAVGAPGQNVMYQGKSRVDAGAVTVFLADPATGAYGAGTTLTQASPGVANAPEAGDQFGYAMTSGDFDGDHYADLAVSANREKLTDAGGAARKDAGLVIVLWGGPDGLTGDSTALPYNPNGIHAGAFVGDALASGDMDGDGIDDLAVGSPGTETVGVYRGDSDRVGFGSNGAEIRISESSPNTPGTKHVGTAKKAGDLFGEALAIGDFDGDGLADLAVGAPYDYDDKGYAVGAVVVFPGDSADLVDLSNGGPTRWSPFTPGVLGTGHTFTVKDLPDSFGRTLAVGDFDGDGVDDLAIGIPGSPVKRGKTTHQDAGRVQILFGKTGKGVTSRDRLLSQDSTGIAAVSHKGDLFGASLAATHRPGGHDVLAVGSAKEAIWALPDGKGAGSKVITQNSANVWGKKQKGNGFGSFVRYLDRLDDPTAEALAISTPGQSSGRGAVLILPAGSKGLPTGTDSKRRLATNGGLARQAGAAFGWLGDSH